MNRVDGVFLAVGHHLENDRAELVATGECARGRCVGGVRGTGLGVLLHWSANSIVDWVCAAARGAAGWFQANRAPGEGRVDRGAGWGIEALCR